MTASIRFANNPTPHQTTAGTPIVLSNFDNTGVAAWEWTLLDRPTGSAASISGAASAVASVTPDVPGSYLVRLRTWLDVGMLTLDGVDKGITFVRYVAVPTWRVPAAGETGEVNPTRGWAEEVNTILAYIQANIGGPASNSPPLDITEPGGEDPGVATTYSRSDHAHAIDTITVANTSVTAISIVGSGDLSGPLRIRTDGLSGPIEIVIKPSIPTGAKGKAVYITGGQGDTNQNGGDVFIDTGPANGGASTAGVLKIAKTTATTIQSGIVGTGSSWTHEGAFSVNGGDVQIDGQDVATQPYVDQPRVRDEAGTTGAFAQGDIGHVLFCTNAGAVTIDLPDLSVPLIAGRVLVLTLQATGAATAITVDPGVGVTIDGAGANYVAAVGRSRTVLLSLDGLAWYSGTP